MLGRFEKRGEIGILFVDNPPVNAISAGVRQTLIDAVKLLAADPQLKIGIIACAGRTFMAGADITEFGKAPLPPSFQDATDALEGSAKPLIAAIHGTAFGGGLEMALSCDYRVALASAQVGLPEVKLGLLPGAGATQRLPRLIGIPAALDAMTSGDPLPATVAFKAGVIDTLIEGDLVEGAVQFAQQLLRSGGGKKRVGERKVDTTGLPANFFADARKRLAREKRNLFAPQKIVDALEAAATLPFEAGLKREQELFLECGANSQSRAMQHVFFAERKAAQIPGLPKGTQTRAIRSVAVIGAGTMGGGIAMNFANAGIPVTVLEANQEGLTRGLGIVRKNYENTAAKGRLTAAQVEERMGLLTPTLSYDALGDADLIIEAVFETMAIKKEVFARLDKVAKQGAILASNTSYLSIDEIAASTGRPADVLGLHFFSPANVMRLLEIVRGAQTAPEVLATALDLARKIKKVGVVAGNRNGFIGNRMLTGYAYHAEMLVLEGAAPEQIDSAMRDFGMPMGPFQMNDLAGLDIGYKSRKDREPGSYDARASQVANLLVEQGRLGQKTQAGFYDYTPGDRTPKLSPITADLIAQVRKDTAFKQRTFTDQEIVERCMLSLMNVGCDVLSEGVAYRSSDIDVVYLYGYGFPAYRGGPMFWAENEIGLKKALEKIKGYSAIVGERWTRPSALLEKLVAEGKGFSSLDKS